MSGYIGNIPTPQATQTRDTFTATSGQTSFATSGYTPGFLDVFLNGVHLVNGTDYTASNGSDVVLTSGATTGDNLEVVAYTTFQVVDQSFSGNFSVDSPTFVVDAANNRVGVGTVAPLARLQASTEGTSTTPNTNMVARFVTNGSDADAHIQISNGVDHSANIGIAGGANLYFANDGVERARIDASGHLIVPAGITLGTAAGVYSAANTLDDYEEGTFTPSILGYSGTTYADRQGKYTKIGNLVIAEIYIDVSSIGSFAGNSRIDGWPFAASAAINQSVGQVRLGLANATTVNANSNSLYLGFYLNTSTAFLYSQTGSTYNGNVWQAGVLAATAVYRTNS